MIRFTFLLFLLIISRVSVAQVAINTEGLPPDSSAMLDIGSHTKGFLPPRMTQVEMNAIHNPVQGLMLFCTDCGTTGSGSLAIYQHGVWKLIAVKAIDFIAPTASVTIQPTCALPTGTIVITAPLGTAYEYSINSINWQVSPIFTGLTPNTYFVTMRNAIDPSNVSPAAILIVNPPAGVPSAPTAIVSLQPSCAVPTGTIKVTAPLGVIYEYSINGFTWQVSPTFEGLAPNTYSVTARKTSDPT